MLDRSFLAWPFFDSSHRELVPRLEDWASKHAVQQGDEDSAARALVKSLGQAGWLKYSVPAPHGLLPRLDVRSLCLARETLARYSSLADFAFAMQGLGSGPISLFGSDELKTRYLAPVARGEAISAFALSEAQSGSDVANSRSGSKSRLIALICFLKVMMFSFVA